MQRLPPLRYIRKTTLVFLVVFLCFIAHRIFVSVSGMEQFQHATKDEKKTPIFSVVCRNIVGGAPFGVDSIFPVHTRLHFYSELPKLSWDIPQNTIRHVWYNGADTVQIVYCTMLEDACESSIAPKNLGPGEWSVDAVNGRKLLSSRQFKVEPARE